MSVEERGKTAPAVRRLAGRGAPRGEPQPTALLVEQAGSGTQGGIRALGKDAGGAEGTGTTCQQPRILPLPCTLQQRVSLHPAQQLPFGICDSRRQLQHSHAWWEKQAAAKPCGVLCSPCAVGRGWPRSVCAHGAAVPQVEYSTRREWEKALSAAPD